MPVKKRSAYSLKGVAFSYGGNRVLEGVTAEILEGDYLGIVGPNGGGKTTLLKILLGILEPSEGEVKLFGGHVSNSPLRSKVGYVPQRSASVGELFPATVEEVVRSGQTLQKNEKAFKRAVEVVGIEHLLKRRIGTLSGGERQRAFIARALAADPKVLILDEPTSAVDVQSQEQMYEFFHELRKKMKLTIILVSHDVDIIVHEVDQVLCLNRHLVCHGPASTIARHPYLIHGHT